MQPLRCLYLVLSCAPAMAQAATLSQFGIEGVPSLVARWPTTTVGRLLAEPAVAACWRLGAQRLQSRLERQDLLLRAARSENVELAHWAVARLPAIAMRRALAKIEVADLQALAWSMTEPPAGEDPASWWSVACAPRADGRLATIFEAEVRALSTWPSWAECEGVKINGSPARAFVSQPTDHERFAFAPQSPARCWMAHMPNAFYFGGGLVDQFGSLGPATISATPGVTFTGNLARHAELFATRGGMAGRISSLGIDPATLRWHVGMQGENLHEEVAVEYGGTPRGAFGSLLRSRTAAPPQALPAGALLQLRFALEPGHLLAAIETLAGIEIGWSPAARQELDRVLTGGVALGLGAPARGALLPRLYASFGAADVDGLQTLLAVIAPGSRRQVVLDGTNCTVCTVPGLPATIHPTFGIRNGVLHVTESLASMTSLLAAQRTGALAMAIGAAPLPPGDDESMTGFDLTCDDAGLYSAWYENWLPWLERTRPTTWPEPLLDRDDMPRPEVVAPLLGGSRGVLRRTDHGIALHMHGPLGGPLLASLGMAYGPLLSGWFHADEVTPYVIEELTQARLRQAWHALDVWRVAHGTWPARLGDLIAAGELAAEVLILPDDPHVEASTGRDGLRVRSSFRYFPTPPKLAGHENLGSIVMIAIAPSRQGRLMLIDDGSVVRLADPSIQRAVDRLLRATRP